MTRTRLTPLVGAVLFGGALWLLHRALRDVSYHDIVAAVRILPAPRLALALACTALGYGALTAYDWLGCRYAGHPLPYRRTATAAFVGFAFSQTLGLPLLSGGAVRLRFYSGWGLTTGEIARVIGFSALTFWVGFGALGAVTFLLDAPPLPAMLHLPLRSAQPLGALLLLLVAGYVVLVTLRRRPVALGEWTVELPPAWMVGPQLLVATLDWALAGTTLWALLPPGTVTLSAFLALFLLAQCAGLVSHVPGGLGVFEAVMVAVLAPPLGTHAVVAALVAYRLVYYFVPLLLAALVLAAHELGRRRTALRRMGRRIDAWAAVVPHALAALCFLCGAVLLFSSATPAVHWRLAWVERWLPLGLLETSHFLGSLAGVGLLMLARDLQRRLDAAYVAAAGLLLVGIVASLLKGIDYEEALVLALTLAALLPTRREFYRRGRLLGARFTPGWTTAIVVVIATSAWLVVFAHRHVGYAHELWWQFEFRASAPRAMRATTGAIIVALFAAAWMLRRPVSPEPGAPTAADLERARPVIAADRSTMGYLALLGDKALLWSDSGRAFLMYAIEGRSWVALADPVGDPREHAELAWRFRELSDRHDGFTVFYEVAATRLALYVDLGLTLAKLGEEAHVPLPDFTLAGGARKSLRQGVHRLADEGLTFRLAPPDEVVARMAELRAVSDAWLAAKHQREKGFSLGCFAPAYLRHFPAALIERRGELIAFANVWCGGDKHELSIDLMRHRPDAPGGTMDLLFVELMQWGRAEGYATFNLGMAPLSGLPEHALAPAWNRLGALVFRHGEHFYNFQGLRAYKEKFAPTWTPRYLAAPGGLVLARVLANLATLVARSPRTGG